ncbi:bone morphogenetic protein receptor type-2-like [Aplochiton taeniatus]
MTLFASAGEKLKPSNEGTATTVCSNDLIADVDAVNLQLQEVLGRGHFATVWHGTYQGSPVAVKIFPSGCKQQFWSEKDVYQLPLMVHSGIASFLRAMKIGRKSGEEEWVLLLELATCGSLHSFLSDNTSDWMMSLKLAQSLSEGLAFLHSDFYKHGVHKPAVAHRDLSSSNVLVRADGSCALSDFGCSTIIGRWKGNTELMLQVGTLRYMSPEVIEGSVCLTTGLFLLQADSYALGLLLWEIWTRCSDVYGGRSAPEYRLPYEAELGSSLSLESLVFYVCDLCKRPSVPKQWEQFPQGFSLQEIIIDCWDHEPDARLSAQRAADRLLSLQPYSSI